MNRSVQGEKKRLKRKIANSRKQRATKLSIRRSSGRNEKFDRERLARTLGRSGVSFVMARDIAKKITRQIAAESRTRKVRTVTAARIRRIVGEELAKRNPTVGAAYRGGRLDETLRSSRTSVVKPRAALKVTNNSIDRGSVIHDKSKRRTSPR